ncbi:MBL fold metallo-hydrolase [Rhodanobacter glycinis]|uniref:MBL fold metallo-hydrolase n=1 Tax=Rhodanobacter glycinis TaxID=582702 RepID=UPI001126BE03|nr:MBL fold metallo-hydrolase [Rhodanobacter glycinis]TPG46736.1 MBL fold metallo-hydrolase [Rhodanobacter glycinis]
MHVANCRRAIAIAFLLVAFFCATATAQEIRVSLLGTGAPSPGMQRFGPSTLVEAGKHKLLFDAGRGALQRLAQLNIHWRDVDGVFLTHLHSDHVVGFPDLWLTGWLVRPGRQRPLHVWGPAGTRQMMAHLEQAYAFDIRIRQSDDRATPAGVVLLVADIAEGVVFEQDGVKVTAFAVDHGPVKPAFGYRVDYAGRSVVLSGDTRLSPNLIRHAQGVDVLVHEVVAPSIFHGPASVIEHHTTPAQAGEVFARTKPRLAVYSHIVPPTAAKQDLIPPTRKSYPGPLVVGEDLMVIYVGEKIGIHRFGRTSATTRKDGSD